MWTRIHGRFTPLYCDALPCKHITRLSNTCMFAFPDQSFVCIYWRWEKTTRDHHIYIYTYVQWWRQPYGYNIDSFTSLVYIGLSLFEPIHRAYCSVYVYGSTMTQVRGKRKRQNRVKRRISQKTFISMMRIVRHTTISLKFTIERNRVRFSRKHWTDPQTHKPLDSSGLSWIQYWVHTNVFRGLIDTKTE